MNEMLLEGNILSLMYCRRIVAFVDDSGDQELRSREGGT